MRSLRVGLAAAWLAGSLSVGTGVGAADMGSPTPGPPAVGPLGVPLHPADAPCVNGRPDEAGASEPANDAYLDDHTIDWASAAPAAVGLDTALLQAGLAEAARAPTVLSLLIVRGGRLVVEEYFHGATADQSRNLHSVTKSLLGLLVGAAIDEGLLPGIETPIGGLVAEAAGTEVGAVTVEQLLAMSGGLARLQEPFVIEDVVAQPLVATPGERFEYNDAGPELLALALERATPDGLCGYAHRVLAPLGITVDHWHENPGGGVTGRAYAFLTPRELARIGQLVLQGGRWDGEQVIPEAWLDAMLEPRFDIDGEPYRGPGACIGDASRRAYGLLWRIFEVDGRVAWTASGYGGQFLVIVPSLDLVMVVTHDTFHDGSMPLQRSMSPHAFLESYVLPGITDAGPDGRSCATDLVVAKADGSDPRVIGPGPADDVTPEWSPDGSRVAFVSLRDLNPEVYVVDRDGTDLTRLTHDWAVDIFPRWSPDGSRLAFLSDRDAVSMGGAVESDVQVMELATGQVHRVTSALRDVRGLAWSPDGGRIAFVRSEVGDGLGDLWVVDSGGGTPTILAAGRFGWPSWSPDGTRMAVVTSTSADSALALGIGSLDLVTGVVTDLGRGSDLPTWTGDGLGIVTSIAGAAGPVIVTIDPIHGVRTAIGGLRAGRPSPDGRWVVSSERAADGAR